MINELEKYEGVNYSIPQSVKINAELERILATLMAKEGYTKPGNLFRDLLWTSRHFVQKNTDGILTEYQKEYPDNQRNTNFGDKKNTNGIPIEYQSEIPTETPHNTTVLHALHGNTPHNTDVLHGNTPHNTARITK